jgi:hypothetical protein
MSVIYLVHEKHGTHVAYSLDEVKRLEASGWRLKDAPAVSDAVAPVEAASVETLHLPKRGPGRPPKPRAS